MLATHQRGDVSRQRVGGERPCRNHDRAVERWGNPPHLFARDPNQPVPANRVGDGLREPLAIDGQRRARGDSRAVSGAHHDRAEAAHLLLQEADGVIEFVTAEGIAADQLRESVGLVDRRPAHRPHFVERHRYAERRSLPCRFAPGQAAADDVNHVNAE
jgi:hypothetical protein